MSDDFYCDEVLSGKTNVHRVLETENILAFHHMRPSWPVLIVVIPKKHIGSLFDLEESDDKLVLELLSGVKQVAKDVFKEHSACRIVTNVGKYQDSKHLHWHICAGQPLDYDQ
jgi:histidine triad (HIT) family protein